MAGPLVANLKPGAGTITIDNETYFTKGAPSAGCQGDIALLTVDQRAVPLDAVIVNKVFQIKGTCAEVTAVSMADMWGETVATLGLANDVTPPSITVAAVIGAVTVSLTTAVATDFGDITSEPGQYVAVGFTFSGLAATDTNVGSIA